MASRYARSLALIALVLLMASEPVFAQTNVDDDTDDDNYIEVASHAQLNAVRHDPNGNGDATQADYLAAFPNRITTSTKRMGCPSGTCTGYERIADLDFDSDGDGDVDASDHGGSYWNSGAGWDPIGTNSARYATHFKGNGHTINNLFINRNFAGDNGLFGSIHTTSRTESLGITNASVTGSNFTGILVGTNYGTVVACYTTGTVQGNRFVGGLVGVLDANSGGTPVVNSSYSTAYGSARSFIGGLVGRMVAGSITNSYSTGAVSGTGSNIGGLIGGVSTATVTDSYWDTSTSGYGNSTRGTGKTTSELQSPTTATYYNWNANLDGQPGNDDPWTFGKTDQYPVLKYAGMDTTVQYNLQPPGIPTSVTVTPKADTLDVRWRASSYATGYKV